LSDFNDWTWADFCIKAYAYNRMEKDDWYKVREVAYASLIGGGVVSSKKMSKEKFMPLGDKVKEEVNKDQVNAFMKAQMEYLKNKKNGTK